jgi:hypothetical protein
MNLGSYFSLGRLTKFAKIFLFLVVTSSLFGCQPLDTAPISTAPDVEVQILTPSLLTETPIPACISLPGVQLNVDISSENSVHLKITGLEPNEAVYMIFSSQFEQDEKTIGCCEGEFADENGNYQHSVGLRGDEIDSEFKDWQLRVVHSRGSTCTEFSLP